MPWKVPHQNAEKVKESYPCYLYAISPVQTANFYETHLISIICNSEMMEHLGGSQWVLVPRCLPFYRIKSKFPEIIK